MFFLYQIIILLIILFSPIIIILRIFRNKEDKKRFIEKCSISSRKRNKGNLTPQQDDNVGVEWEIRDLLKNRNFWILTAVFSLQFSSMMAILAHLTFYASERGWADQAAFIFGMYAILSLTPAAVI